MRRILLVAVLFAGCSSEMHGKWPSLAARPGEIGADAAATGTCAGCGQDNAATMAVPAPPEQLPLPADAEARIVDIGRVIAAIEAEAPAQARIASAAIAAAARDPARQGDAEVARSRFEALFMPLSIEERRLDMLADDVAGRDGADPVLAQITALRGRAAALQALRVSLPD